MKNRLAIQAARLQSSYRRIVYLLLLAALLGGTAMAHPGKKDAGTNAAAPNDSGNAPQPKNDQGQNGQGHAQHQGKSQDPGKDDAPGKIKPHDHGKDEPKDPGKGSDDGKIQPKAKGDASCSIRVDAIGKLNRTGIDRQAGFNQMGSSSPARSVAGGGMVSSSAAHARPQAAHPGANDLIAEAYDYLGEDLHDYGGHRLMAEQSLAKVLGERQRLARAEVSQYTSDQRVEHSIALLRQAASILEHNPHGNLARSHVSHALSELQIALTVH